MEDSPPAQEPRGAALPCACVRVVAHVRVSSVGVAACRGGEGETRESLEEGLRPYLAPAWDPNNPVGEEGVASGEAAARQSPRAWRRGLVAVRRGCRGGVLPGMLALQCRDSFTQLGAVRVLVCRVATAGLGGTRRRSGLSEACAVVGARLVPCGVRASVGEGDGQRASVGRRGLTCGGAERGGPSLR